MEVAEIQSSRSGDVNLADQRWGSGPDVVLVSNIEIAWEHGLYRNRCPRRAGQTGMPLLPR